MDNKSVKLLMSYTTSFGRLIVFIVERIVDEHRKEALYTCPEDCWCWTLEGNVMELKKLTEEIDEQCKDL